MHQAGKGKFILSTSSLLKKNKKDFETFVLAKITIDYK